MSELKITNQDFYLKQRIRKATPAKADLLLSHRAYVAPFDNFEYHVFLESHGTEHHIWQIVDFGLPQKGKKVFSIVDSAEEILSGLPDNPSLLAGRLFSISGAPRSEELTDEIIMRPSPADACGARTRWRALPKQ